MHIKYITEGFDLQMGHLTCVFLGRFRVQAWFALVFTNINDAGKCTIIRRQ